MHVRVLVPSVSTRQAVEGMRTPFLRAFGRGPVAQRLGAAAWCAFHSALTHGTGLQRAASHARTAAEERNTRVALVARWSGTRIAGAVERAARAAADAG